MSAVPAIWHLRHQDNLSKLLLTRRRKRGEGGGRGRKAEGGREAIWKLSRRVEELILAIPGTISLIMRTRVIQPHSTPGALHYFQFHNMF